MKAVAYPVPRTKRSFSKSHCQVQPFQSNRKRAQYHGYNSTNKMDVRLSTCAAARWTFLGVLSHEFCSVSYLRPESLK